MICQHDNKAAFLDWASSVMTEKQHKWLEDNMLHVEQYAIAKGLIRGSIYTTTDNTTLLAVKKAISKNKLFQIKYRRILKNIFDAFDAYIQFCSEHSSLEGVSNSVQSVSIRDTSETVPTQTDYVVEVGSSGEKDGIQRILSRPGQTTHKTARLRPARYIVCIFREYCRVPETIYQPDDR